MYYERGDMFNTEYNPNHINIIPNSESNRNHPETNQKLTEDLHPLFMNCITYCSRPGIFLYYLLEHIGTIVFATMVESNTLIRNGTRHSTVYYEKGGAHHCEPPLSQKHGQWLLLEDDGIDLDRPRIS